MRVRRRSVSAWAAAPVCTLALVACAGGGASQAPAAATVASHSVPDRAYVPVSLTRIPGNICCARRTRASVSVTGVLTTAAAPREGQWHQTVRRHLSAAELRALRMQLRRLDPSTLRGVGPACHHLPIGDVGGYDLRVGTHESNCPPTVAEPLIRLLSRYLPRA